MGHSLSLLLATAGLTIALPTSVLAMSKALTASQPDAPAATAVPLTADGHHYRAIVFGGSCEEGWATNDFHDGFVQISSQLNGVGWDVRPFFAGDSAHCAGTAADPCPTGLDTASWSVATIAQAAGKDPSTVGRASRANLLASLDQAAADLTSGDELLLVIDTHGYGEQVQGQTYWDHGICISSDDPHGKVANFDPAKGEVNSPNVEGLMYFTDPDLQTRLKKLQTAGVKMAFLDDSCYGGGSIPVLSAYGCTMSSSTSQQENFEESEGGATESQRSENGIAFNLPDLLMSTDADNLASQSLHPQAITPHVITMEELWMRILARSKIAGVPEFSGFMAEAQEAETLGNWAYGFEGDVAYRRGDTPFTSTPGPNIYTTAPLTSYAQTYLNSITDEATQTTDAAMVASYWLSPGVPGTYDIIDSKTIPDLQSAISGFQGQWNSWVAQFNVLTAEEKPILADLASLNMNVTWTFTGALAGTEDLLNTVLPTVQGQAGFAFQTSVSGNPWIAIENEFDTPDATDFAGNTQTAIDSIAYFMDTYKLQQDAYIAGLDDSYSDALGAMIIQAEKNAWNAATPQIQNQMRSDFQKLSQLRTQETEFLNELPVDTIGYLAQARMYSYLGYRKQAALLDPKLGQCSDFVLKRY